MLERNHGMYSICNCSSTNISYGLLWSQLQPGIDAACFWSKLMKIFNVVNTGPLVTHAPLESPPEMLNGVEIQALSRPVVKTSDLMDIFPPPLVRPSMTAGVALLEHETPVLFP
ncbi:hypothetical protein PHYBLDRAFT_150330 [Phycomyces blakesleeanus NRRL 1555(-)]|uniref:Uncharacterized protein n=1 Tax=Phycomyces blakesleeanus (strain ATCC 8743b / DSM 1359 / FGSC 10004 / NBRC 33097 / NRRL 1555) TaxID=763407 RepID=A0A167KRV4_PHYB8|nr:hypothetical protein PHYBLDRAFT_150330 [Phycomyces blakesleeanus NRRL 1555(-)]OAD68737.1 hypothetical protein PHYBLDRAFT_150330 [Phycomyces blakesleeanus NRRL 1555(-)]|eukprot:XP_018286777.1 hypothetical protein PHYBLDRAFT_150330 [Phycomyces blakesleeanus NRRL 1555(-)]